jgi:hypothetical protein
MSHLYDMREGQNEKVRVPSEAFMKSADQSPLFGIWTLILSRAFSVLPTFQPRPRWRCAIFLDGQPSPNGMTPPRARVANGVVRRRPQFERVSEIRCGGNIACQFRTCPLPSMARQIAPRRRDTIRRARVRRRVIPRGGGCLSSVWRVIGHLAGRRGGLLRVLQGPSRAAACRWCAWI